MKKSELKKILKPLITECIKEVMFEDGGLVEVISEVVSGISAPRAEESPLRADPLLKRMKRNAFSGAQNIKLTEQKQKLMTAIGENAYNGVNLFEGTVPTSAQGNPSQQALPMSGVDPGDSGIDISNLFGSVGNHWGAHMSEIKEGK